jgi:FlaA1/EpsC-like NDP-sugar epimerase
MKIETMDNKYQNKTVMITGAGGSIGSSLCHEILKYSPHSLILVDHSEHDLFNVHEEISSKLSLIKEDSKVTTVTPVLLNCASEEFYTKYKYAEIDFVFNAAAYKHVNFSALNPDIYFKNNVLSTYYSQQIALSCNANYVLVSTDKAVEPMSIMGKSKRLCEMLVLVTANTADVANQHLVVRFGNVLNSSGSVVPIFRKQIDQGGPVTVTDAGTTRYFMSITEACNLVLNVSNLKQPRGIFVLDMGQPVNIHSLACNMIEQASLKVTYEEPTSGEIQIKFIGLRPGEKLHEKLSYSTIDKTNISRICQASEMTNFGEPVIRSIFEALKQSSYNHFDTFNWQTGQN